MSRPSSVASNDSVDAAVEEVLDFFDKHESFPAPPKSPVGGALFGTSPRQFQHPPLPLHPPSRHHRAMNFEDQENTPSRRDSITLPWRPTASELTRGPSTSAAGVVPASTPNRVRSGSAAIKSQQPSIRPSSPDIETILAKTPRPRRTTSSIFSSSARTGGPATNGAPDSLRGTRRSLSSLNLRSDAAKLRRSGMPSNGGDEEESILSISDYGALAKQEDERSDSDGGSETDSSIDIHTPLPHLMFRDGLLSPRSKLLPEDLKPSTMYSFSDLANSRSRSVMSIASTVGSVATKSGLQRDPRDTERRRLRHRDGNLLRVGMGLTTGLGWSDSEDEDAPSALTRRLITTTLGRKRSKYSSGSSRPTSTTTSYTDSRLGSPVPVARFSAPIPATKHFLSRKSSASGLPSSLSSPSLIGKRSMSMSQIQSRSTTASFPSIAQLVETKLPMTPEEDTISVSQASERTRVSSNVSTASARPDGRSSLPTLIISAPGIPVRQRTTSSTSSVSTSTSKIPRGRSDSVGSAVGGVPITSRSRGTASAPASARPTRISDSSPPPASIASTSSTSSSASSSFGVSNVPRPLRLPQTAPMRSLSQEHISSASSGSFLPRPGEFNGKSLTTTHSKYGDPGRERKRTLSGPRPPPPNQPLPTPSPNSSNSASLSLFSSSPRSSGVPSLPSSSSSSAISSPSFSSASTPTSISTSASTGSIPKLSSSTLNALGARPRPTATSSLIGSPGARPRTGTGMAYRTHNTSSYPTFQSQVQQAQAEALRMRSTSLASAAARAGSGIAGIGAVGMGGGEVTPGTVKI